MCADASTGGLGYGRQMMDLDCSFELVDAL